MKIDPNAPAFPQQWPQGIPGLTIRAHFAAMFVQGSLASGDDYNYAVERAIKATDLLIAALNAPTVEIVPSDPSARLNTQEESDHP